MNHAINNGNCRRFNHNRKCVCLRLKATGFQNIVHICPSHLRQCVSLHFEPYPKQSLIKIFAKSLRAMHGKNCKLFAIIACVQRFSGSGKCKTTSVNLPRLASYTEWLLCLSKLYTLSRFVLEWMRAQLRHYHGWWYLALGYIAVLFAAATRCCDDIHTHAHIQFDKLQYMKNACASAISFPDSCGECHWTISRSISCEWVRDICISALNIAMHCSVWLGGTKHWGRAATYKNYSNMGACECARGRVASVLAVWENERVRAFDSTLTHSRVSCVFERWNWNLKHRRHKGNFFFGYADYLNCLSGCWFLARKTSRPRMPSVVRNLVSRMGQTTYNKWVDK